MIFFPVIGMYLFSKNDCSNVKYSCASDLEKVRRAFLTRDFKRAEVNQIFEFFYILRATYLTS